METFGHFLQELRRERRLTLGQLSLRSGLSKATLSRWETGMNLPRIPELNRALDALDASQTARANGLRLLDAPRAIYAERRSDNALIRLSRGDLLYGLRQRSGQTQAEVARGAGVSRSLYSQWENDASQPDAGQLHAAAFALGASAEEVAALSSSAWARVPVERDRDALLLAYRDTQSWDDNITPEAYKLFLLSLLTNFGRLVKNGKADIGDIALIVTDFGSCAEMYDDNTGLQNVYHQRALALAAQSNEPVHFHVAQAVRSQLLSAQKTKHDKEQVDAALAWRPRFQSKAGQAYLLSFIAGAIAKDAPEQALRLADRYCALVADDPDEYPCRLRDRGNLLLKCGRPAEAAAFIADLTPQDTFREILKQIELADALAGVGSLADARVCLAAAKGILSVTEYAYVQPRLHAVERKVERKTV